MVIAMTCADEDAVAIIARLIADVQPDVLLTFGPDGGTGHVDHVAVCRWSTMACAPLLDGAPAAVRHQVARSGTGNSSARSIRPR